MTLKKTMMMMMMVMMKKNVMMMTMMTTVFWRWWMSVLTVLWWWWWETRFLWQSMLAAAFWENKSPSRALSGIGCVCPDGVSPDGWWCLSSCWCLGGLSIVFRWSLASWWHFGGVSVSVDGVQRCFDSGSCFSWCFCGVLAVFRWCFGGIEETDFLWSKMVPRAIPNGVNGDVKLCYWGCMLG